MKKKQQQKASMFSPKLTDKIIPKSQVELQRSSLCSDPFILKLVSINAIVMLASTKPRNSHSYHIISAGFRYQKKERDDSNTLSKCPNCPRHPRYGPPWRINKKFFYRDHKETLSPVLFGTIEKKFILRVLRQIRDIQFLQCRT